MYQIPSLSDLVTRARQAFRAYLPGSDAWVWPNNIGPTAKVIGGAVFEVFGFADYIARQKFAGTADSENLDLHGQEYGLARKPAYAAFGPVVVTALDAIAVAVFRRLDGVEFVANSAGSTTGAGTVTVSVVAAIDGVTTNSEAGTPFEIVSGVTDVNGDAAATAAAGTGGIVGGYDVEADGDDWTTDLSTFRGRILFRKRNPLQGGAPSDYVQWAGEVSGVTRVFVERRWAGVGTVRVFPLMDDIYADGIASSGDIARVADYIDTKAPAGALVTVAAPTALPINITITGLTPNTAVTQEAVLAELRAAFRRLSRVAGADTPNGAMPYLATPYSFPRGWIWQAVGNAGGVISDAVTVPSADVTLAAGQFPTLGDVTFA
jgi:uncharacterized phage protein gp47/JayE